MSYLKTWGLTLLTLIIFIGGFRLMWLLAVWVSDLFTYLSSHSHQFLDFLNMVLGSDALVSIFLTLIILSPVIAFFTWLTDL